MQGFLPPYLEMSMESFAKGQDQMREQMARTFGGKTPIAAFEEQARQNMVLFQKALTMWSPFAGAISGRAFPTKEEDAPAQNEEALVELRRQIEAMQKQLDALASPPRKPGA
jgi:polyhydroxyalkanoate synthesis regulator protein